MVEAGQGFGVPREIDGIPNPIGHPFVERQALTPKLGVGADVPTPASARWAQDYSMAEIEFERDSPTFDDIASHALALQAPVAMIAGTGLKGFVPEIAVFDGTDRTNMKDTDNLKDAFSCQEMKDAFASFDESAWLDKASFMYDGEIKSGSAMRANGMTLTMPPAPITGRPSANSREDFNLYLDSGASRNVVFNPALLINQRDPPAGTDQFVVADGVRLTVIGYGDIEMENFKIPDVYLVRGLTVNLISVGHLASSHKVCICFAGNECNLMLSDGRRIGDAIRRDDNQYLLRFLEIE